MNILFMLLFYACFVCIIIFLVKAIKNLVHKNPAKKNFKRSGISVLAMIASLVGFGFTMENIPIESITLSLPDYQEEYDINTDISFEATIFPENATVSSMEYIADENLLTFSKSGITTNAEEGSCEIYIESNGVKSNPISITVVDMAARKAAEEAEQKRLAEEAEQKRLAEEKAAKEAEEKRLAEEAEAKRLAEEKAAKEAEEKRLAEEQAAKEAEEKRLAEEAERQAKQQIAQTNGVQRDGNSSNSGGGNTANNTPAPSSGGAGNVWIPKTGSKYHSNSSCSNMKNPSSVSLEYAQSHGYEPCKKCY